MSKQKKVVIEINDDFLKIAEIEVTRKFCKIKKLAVRKVDEDIGEIGNNLRDLIKDSHIKTKRVMTYLPRYLLTIRHIELPSIDPEEIGSMVDLQIGKETPYSRDEIISDYKTTPSEKEGFSRIMLVIIRKDIVQSYLALLESSHIQVERVGVSSEGTVNWYLLNANVEAEKGKTVAFCDIDSHFTDLTVIAHNQLLFTRSISIGSNQLSDDTGMWQNKFIDELKRSLDIFHNEETGEEEVSAFVASYTEETIPWLQSVVEYELGIAVRVISPFSHMTLTKDVEIKKDAVKGVSFSSMIGMVFVPSSELIDLTPQDAKIGKELEEKAKNLIITGVLCIFIFITLFGIFSKKVGDEEEIVKELTRRQVAIEQEAETIELMMKKNELIDHRLDVKGTALVILDELYDKVPDEIYFNTITFEQGKEVILRGASTSMSHIFKFITTLEGLSYFSNVKTKYATKRRLKNKELTDFEIVCPIKGAG